MNKDSAINKDIIYIDAEDDVTSVIGKVRASDEKIIALVPPKSNATLQSAVNLRLLTRAADNAGKRIVLITSNPGLTALAAGVKIPVAKNLQSKPEIPAASAVKDDGEEDIIKGEELPVGELVAAAALTTTAPELAGALALGSPVKPSEDDITIDELPDLEKDVPAAAAVGSVASKKHALTKVPNFDRFRKWIFIVGGLGIAVILFFVLGNIFWTKADIVIAAQSSDEAINLPLTLKVDGTTDPDQGTIKAVSKELKKTASVDFTPTGTKTTGTKATGTLTLTNASSTDVTTVPAGSKFTGSTSRLVFTTDKDVTVGGVTVSRGSIKPSSAQVSITASAIGTDYNTAAQAYESADFDDLTASGTATSGGTSQTVTVVSAADIQAATDKLAGSNATDAKSQLTGQFGSDAIVIGESFVANDGAVTSTPAQDAQATTAKLTRESTYTMIAVPKSELKTITTNVLSGLIDGDNQKIYDDGTKGAIFSQFLTSPSGVQTIRVVATGKIGPNIDESALKKQIVGKKSAEITQTIRATQGVKDVTVKFSPAWRTTAPSADKINVSFELKNGN